MNWGSEFSITYRPRNEKTREQVPETEEEGHANGSNLVARSQCNNHHTVEGEVDEGHEYKIEEIKEFDGRPLKPNHRVENKSVNDCLDYYIYYLYGHLQKLCMAL